MYITRRHLLGGSALASAAMLAACAGQTSQQIAQTVLTDTSDITNGMANVAVNLKAVGNIPAAVLSAVTTDAANAATAAKDLVASMTSTQAQPIIAQVNADLQVFLKDLGAFASANSTISMIVSDIQIVLPFLLAAVGIILPAAATPSASKVDAARSQLAALPKVSLN